MLSLVSSHFKLTWKKTSWISMKSMCLLQVRVSKARSKIDPALKTHRLKPGLGLAASRPRGLGRTSVGSKSLNLALLRPKLPSEIYTPQVGSHGWLLVSKADVWMGSEYSHSPWESQKKIGWTWWNHVKTLFFVDNGLSKTIWGCFGSMSRELSFRFVDWKKSTTSGWLTWLWINTYTYHF